MFNRQDVYGTVVGFSVRVKDEREQDRNHLVEVGFEVPLTYELADEIMPAMARDLFQKVGGEYQPRPEIQEAIFNVATEQQVMTVKTHPELPADVRVGSVTLRRVKAKKGEAGTWLLSFLATWTLGDPKEAITMIQRLKTGVYLTFEVQQPALDMGPAPVDGEVIGEVIKAQVDGNSTVTALVPRRGRKKKAPATDQGTYEPPPTTLCPGCKNEIPTSVKVCPACGADVQDERLNLPAPADQPVADVTDGLKPV